MTNQQHILVVDDEQDIRNVLERYLKREGYIVDTAADGQIALNMIQRTPPNLIVLDLIMPNLDGLEVMKMLGGSSDIPVIMLTSKDEEVDKLVGLAMGADDYITKPFSVKEVVARVKTVLRRVPKKVQPKPIQTSYLSIGGLTIDSTKRTIKVKEALVTVSAKQFELLWLLANHPGQVFSREQLLDQVWGYDYYGKSRIVDVHIRRLREKIEPDSSQPQFILTVWSVGYKFATNI